MDEEEGMAILFIVGGFISIPILIELKITQHITIVTWFALIGYAVLFTILTKLVYYPRREKK
jgi:hypothetical protein